jgi:hypothetical protein
MSFGVKNANSGVMPYWPIAVAVSWPLLLVFVCFLGTVVSWGGLFVLFFAPVQLLILTAWGASGLFACMWSLQWARQREWRRLLSSVVLALSTLLAAFNLAFVWQIALTAGAYMHFFLLYPSYAAEIAEGSADDPRLTVWKWGGILNPANGVVYDDSDEIASDNPSQAWKKKADRRGIIGYGYPRAMGHFYFADLR